MLLAEGLHRLSASSILQGPNADPEAGDSVTAAVTTGPQSLHRFRNDGRRRWTDWMALPDFPKSIWDGLNLDLRHAHPVTAVGSKRPDLSRWAPREIVLAPADWGGFSVNPATKCTGSGGMGMEWVMLAVNPPDSAVHLRSRICIWRGCLRQTEPHSVTSRPLHPFSPNIWSVFPGHNPIFRIFITEVVLVEAQIPESLWGLISAGDAVEDRLHLGESLHIVRRSYATVVGEPARGPPISRF